MVSITTSFIGESEYSKRIEYDSNSNPIYIGDAIPGSSMSDTVWRIKKMTYDNYDNPIQIEWANGNVNFDKIWNDRLTYIYS